MYVKLFLPASDSWFKVPGFRNDDDSNKNNNNNSNNVYMKNDAMFVVIKEKLTIRIHSANSCYR